MTWTPGGAAFLMPPDLISLLKWKNSVSPTGTGKLLLVRVPKGATPPYGTAQGLFKKRVGKKLHALGPARLRPGPDCDGRG